MILDLPDRAALETFLKTEPYCASGLFASVSIHQTRHVVPETNPGAVAAKLARLKASAA